MRIPLIIASAALVLSAGCTAESPAQDDQSGVDSPTDTSSPSGLAFVLKMSGDPNTYSNCDLAFSALLNQPNSGATEADRSVEVDACVADTSK
jgi:hypothetical protein